MRMVTIRASASGGTAVLLLAVEIATAGGIALPEQAPVPQWREDALRRRAETQAPTPPPALPGSEHACREALDALGVAYSPADPVEGDGGCSLPLPVEVTALSPTIRLQPEALLNCATAQAAARLFQSAGAAAAQKHLEAEIRAVRHSSAYVCRPINGASNLSEHAFGNALDVSGIVLSDGREISVGEHGEDGEAEARFLEELRSAACGIFATVLGPGTDADHAHHFHFDMKKRRRPYCR